MSPAIVGAFVALVVSVLAPLVALPLLHRLHVVDIASARSSHIGVAVRALGVAPLAGILAGAAAATVAGLSSKDALTLAACVVGATSIAVVGLIEDVRGLPIVLRASLQLLLGAASAFALLATAGVPVLAALLLSLAAGLAVAAYVNIANFMDGIDGISAAHGVVVGFCFASLGVAVSSAALTVGGAVLAAAMLGFAPWNVGPQKRFLGDVGSYLLGALVALLAVAAVVEGLPLISVISPLALYGADTSVTLLRRFARGARWYESHREHVYQRLALALTHSAAASIVTVGSALCVLAGAFVAVGVWPWWLATAFIATTSAAYVSLPGALGLEDARWHLDTPPAPKSYPIRPSSSGRALVLGASGFVGTATAQALKAAGLTVTSASAPRVETSARSLDEIDAESDRHHSVVEGLSASFRDFDLVVLAAGLARPDSGATDALYGANVMLPALAAKAADRAGVRRLVHLSSAAVQGRAVELDESWSVNPFSPYSHSKALGELALARIMSAFDDGSPHVDVTIVRATSVQGAGRPTTHSLTRLARSRLSSVAAPGDQPTVVSTVAGLAQFVRAVSTAEDAMQGVRLQPWEDHSVTSALVSLGQREPLVLPQWLCRAVIALTFSVGQFVPQFAGIARRLELLWLGQRQRADSNSTPRIRTSRTWLQEIES